MTAFRFRLATLLRLRESERDLRRQDMAERQRAEEQTAQRIAQLDEAFAGLRRRAQLASRPGPIDVDRLRDTQRYERVLHDEQTGAEQARQLAVAEVENARAAVVEADRDVKTLEKLRQQQQATYREHEHRREQRQLDEHAGRTGDERV